MHNLIWDRKGITMMEVVVSLALLSVGILSLLTVLPSSMRLAGHSDYLGRASGILANQIQVNEALILNPSNPPPTPGQQPTFTVYPSWQQGSVRKQGDLQFYVTPTFTCLDGGVCNAWLVTVNVAWPGNTTGITESLRVVRQQAWTH
jgi:hypothetical protein